MTTDDQASSQRPYLIRAMHEWMSDNGLTPHIVVDAAVEGLRAPPGHDRDGRLFLNVSYAATQALSLGNDHIAFNARFSGTPHAVSVPVDAVLGIYARETGQGMAFADSPPDPDSGPPAPEPDGSDPGDAPDRPTGRPALKIVK